MTLWILSWILWILRNCLCLLIICNSSCIHWLIIHCQVLTLHLSYICQKASQFFLNYCRNFDYVKLPITTIQTQKATYNSQIHGPSIAMIFFCFCHFVKSIFLKEYFIPNSLFLDTYIHICPKLATIAYKRKGCLSFSTFIFLNLLKYTYGWLPLEQYHKIEKRRKEKKKEKKSTGKIHHIFHLNCFGCNSHWKVNQTYDYIHFSS